MLERCLTEPTTRIILDRADSSYSKNREGKISSKGKCVSKVQPVIGDKFAATSKYIRSSPTWKALTDVVTYCIAKDMLLLRSVEMEGFKHMLSAFDARYELPSRRFMS